MRENAALYTSLPDGRASLPAAADGARPCRPRRGGSRLVGGPGYLRKAPRAQPRRPPVLVLRRPGDGEQDARRPHRVGPHAEGRLPALQGAAGASTSATRTASTARACGSRSASSGLGLNSKREIEEYGLEEFARKCRDVVVRSAAELTGVEAPRPVDGLGQRLLHVQRHEHRVHLEVPQDRARARLALPRPPLDRVVPALRHVDLGARADRLLRRPRRPVALRAASRCSTAQASRSSSGRRRRGRCRRTSPRR